MRKLIFVLLCTLFTGLFTSCDEEQVNPTQEGGTTSSNSEQWKDD